MELSVIDKGKGRDVAGCSKWRWRIPGEVEEHEEWAESLSLWL
jgi:hypothetical protein